MDRSSSGSVLLTPESIVTRFTGLLTCSLAFRVQGLSGQRFSSSRFLGSTWAGGEIVSSRLELMLRTPDLHTSEEWTDSHFVVCQVPCE